MLRLSIITAILLVVSTNLASADERVGIPTLNTEGSRSLINTTAKPFPPIILAQNNTETGPGKATPSKSDNRNLPPPVLKNKDKDFGEPVHDVRKDVTYIPIEQLEALHKRLKNPDKNSMDPAVVKAEYDKLYRKLYSERENLTKTALGQKPGKAKTATLEQAYRLSIRLNKLSRPISSNLGEYPGWRPVKDALESSYDYTSFINFSIRKAGRAINSSDKLAAFRELSNLLGLAISIKKELKNLDQIRRDFVDTGIIERVYGQDAARVILKSIDQDKAKLRKLELYIRDYEKAFERKWPAPGEPEYPETPVPTIGILPNAIEMDFEPLPNPCVSVNKC